MFSNPSTVYYGVMGLAAVVCFVAAYQYLRLSTQIAEILNKHSVEWPKIKGSAGLSVAGYRPIRRLAAMILSGEDSGMLPSDPAVRHVLRTARIAGWIFIIGVGVAIACLGAATAGTAHYR